MYHSKINELEPDISQTAMEVSKKIKNRSAPQAPCLETPVYQGTLKCETIQSCSDAFARILGTTPEALKNSSILDHSPPRQKTDPDKSSAELFTLRLRAARTGLPQSFEWQLQATNGTPINALFHLQSSDDSNSEAFNYRLRVFKDESSKESIRESKLLLQQMLDNASAVVYVKDYDGRFLFVNKQFANTFAMQEKEIIGKSAFDIFDKHVAQSFLDTDRQVFQAKHAMEFEEIGIVNGEQHVYLSIKFPLFNNDNDVYAVCGISTDITERKKTEDAFRNIALGVSGATGDNVFEAISWYLAKTLDIDFAFVGRLDDSQEFVSTLAIYCDGKIIPNVTYTLADTPCYEVVNKDYYFVAKDIRKQYPQDGMLSDLNLDAYAGFPLFNSNGKPLGLISIGNRRPLQETHLVKSVLEIFSVRASAEMERIAADEAKLISEESYRSIFEASEDAIFVHDLDNGAIVDVNPKACRNFGYDRSEFLNLDILDLGPGAAPFDVSLVQSSMEKARQGQSQHVEWQRRNKDGSLSWDEVFIKRATIAGIDRLLAISRDITDKKQAQDKLKASEALYRIIFNSSVDGLLLLDEYGVIVDTNPIFKSMLGYASHEFTKVHALDIIPEDHQDTFRNFMSSVIQSGNAHIVGQGLYRDSERRILDIYGVRISHFGKPQILAIVRDITEQNRAAEALRKSEDRLRATIEAALDPIISMDNQGNVVEFNPAAESCFDYQRQDVIGRSLADLIIPVRFREAHRQGIKHFINGGPGPYIGRRIEVTAMRSDGSEFPAELAIDVSQGTDGKLFIGYMRDITERKKAEESRQKLEAQLRQAQKMEAIGHLTGGIAHDFNNILTSTMGYVAMAEELSENLQNQKLQKYLARAHRSGKKARNLIQQMLTFSRGQRGEPRALSLGTLVKESIQLMQASLPSSVEMQLNIEPGLSHFLIDPVHLEQVLMNLCINARDAVQNHGNLNIVVRQHKQLDCNCESCKQPFSGNYLELSVEDNGSGIPTAIMDRVFEPFYSTKEVGKGSGMGLSMVHGIVHEYGGHITVESKPNQGTKISVFFQPLNAQPVDTEAGQPDDHHTGSSPEKLDGHVLLVDDENDVAEFMFDMLEEWGLTVSVSTSSVSALELFSRSHNTFDLIITDHTMPKMTGLELTREIRKIDQEIPIIMYTGYSEEIQDKELETIGIQQLLKKPIDIAEVHQHLKQLL